MRVRQQTSKKRRNHGKVYVSEVYYYENLISQFVYQVNSEVPGAGPGLGPGPVKMRTELRKMEPGGPFGHK